jgi:hypothetical protein
MIKVVCLLIGFSKQFFYLRFLTPIKFVTHFSPGPREKMQYEHPGPGQPEGASSHLPLPRLTT